MRALRLRSPVRTPSGFAVLTLVTLALMWVIVPSGAVVRLTDSGLGCPDWPTCEADDRLRTTGHALIEYTNRILSGIVGVGAVVTWIVAWRALRRPDGRAPLVAGRGRLPRSPRSRSARSPSRTGLHPMAVGSHFLLSMVALADGGCSSRWRPATGATGGSGAGTPGAGCWPAGSPWRPPWCW